MKTAILGIAAATLLLGACSSNDTQPAAAPVAAAVPAGPTPGSQEDLVANVGDRVLFDFDKSLLRPEGDATLDKQAAWLAQYAQNNVQIAGNCDERGTEEYNIALGHRRANVASQYLQAHGVAKARISTISYGKDRPTALGSDEAAWAQNRNAITSLK